MKSIVKQIVIASAVMFLAVPAFASDMTEAPRLPTKGTKSYQTSRARTPDDQTQIVVDRTKAEDIQNIAPAAGATDDKIDDGKSFGEELRLPRKN